MASTAEDLEKQADAQEQKAKEARKEERRENKARRKLNRQKRKEGRSLARTAAKKAAPDRFVIVLDEKAQSSAPGRVTVIDQGAVASLIRSDALSLYYEKQRKAKGADKERYTKICEGLQAGDDVVWDGTILPEGYDLMWGKPVKVVYTPLDEKDAKKAKSKSVSANIQASFRRRAA